MRRLLLALTAASALLLAGCTAAPDPSPDTSASPTPTTTTVVRLAGSTSTAVAAGTTAAGRAVETSRALFAAAPGIVLAPEGDTAAERSAATEAARLHVPMLLTDPVPSASASVTSTPPPAAPDGVAAEAARLGAGWSVGYGGATIPGLRSRSADAVQPQPAQQPCAVLVATDPAGDAAAVASARAAGASVVEASGPDLNGQPAVIAALAKAQHARAVLVGRAFAARADLAWSVTAARSGWTYAGGTQRAWDGRSLHVALYGTPSDGRLGVLGQQAEPATIDRVRSLVSQYARLTDRRVSPMLEVIATVAAGGPTGNGDYSSEIPPSSLEPYVDRALAAGIPVILDLQPGRSTFLTQAKEYASLLEKPGVGLALDPEWRLGPKQKPLKQIGRVSAAEVNATSAWLAQLVQQHGLPPKPFVLHEFRLTMLQQRQDIVVDRPELDTLIHVDGQGSQPAKQATWRAVRAGAPAVGWGWKNFLKKDHPVLTPAQTVQQVHPTPDLITYQ
ncbi:hypothetical protein [Amnibacterium sp.]|uniref:hypothetical protein n=1 Tax=Amnibacterium sp. TaxID=1872496 RepID=UPI003F7B6D8C